MCIPFSSFAKEICLDSSGIVHQPAIGEKRLRPVGLRDFRGGGESAFSLILFVRSCEVLGHVRSVEVRQLGPARAISNGVSVKAASARSRRSLANSASLLGARDAAFTDTRVSKSRPRRVQVT